MIPRSVERSSPLTWGFEFKSFSNGLSFSAEPEGNNDKMFSTCNRKDYQEVFVTQLKLSMIAWNDNPWNSSESCLYQEAEMKYTRLRTKTHY